jgi:hypothetical protein
MLITLFICESALSGEPLIVWHPCKSWCSRQESNICGKAEYL